MVHEPIVAISFLYLVAWPFPFWGPKMGVAVLGARTESHNFPI